MLGKTYRTAYLSNGVGIILTDISNRGQRRILLLEAHFNLACFDGQRQALFGADFDA